MVVVVVKAVVDMVVTVVKEVVDMVVDMSSPVTFLLLLLCLSSSGVTGDTPPTTYEALAQYDFPAGLLPVGVTGYTLNEETGEFQVNIGKTCSYSVEGYDLKYQSTISGTISKDKLTNLKGISVKVLFFWVNIVEVTRDGDELSLSVEILSAAFDITGFVDSPQCGCGFDCNTISTTYTNVNVNVNVM